MFDQWKLSWGFTRVGKSNDVLRVGFGSRKGRDGVSAFVMNLGRSVGHHAVNKFLGLPQPVYT